MQGDPSAVPYAVENVRQVIGKKPVFGICMGHQLLGQAFGGETFKLKFGHHGGNHPIRYAPTSAFSLTLQKLQCCALYLHASVMCKSVPVSHGTRRPCDLACATG